MKNIIARTSCRSLALSAIASYLASVSDIRYSYVMLRAVSDISYASAPPNITSIPEIERLTRLVGVRVHRQR